MKQPQHTQTNLYLRAGDTALLWPALKSPGRVEAAIDSAIQCPRLQALDVETRAVRIARLTRTDPKVSNPEPHELLPVIVMLFLHSSSLPFQAHQVTKCRCISQDSAGSPSGRMTKIFATCRRHLQRSIHEFLAPSVDHPKPKTEVTNPMNRTGPPINALGTTIVSLFMY